MTDSQDILDRIDHQIYGLHFDKLAALNVLEDAANEIKRLRQETSKTPSTKYPLGSTAQRRDINQSLSQTVRLMNIAGFIVPIVANFPYQFTIEVALELLTPGIPFVGCYSDTPEGRLFSLRSRDNGIDVLEIAGQYGGGGHRHSAAFRVSQEIARGFEIA